MGDVPKADSQLTIDTEALTRDLLCVLRRTPSPTSALGFSLTPDKNRYTEDGTGRVANLTSRDAAPAAREECNRVKNTEHPSGSCYVTIKLPLASSYTM